MRHLFIRKKWVFGIALLSMSCEEIITPRAADSSPRAVFEHLWEDVNNRYSFFEEKGIDWLDIREIYSHRINDDMDPFSLFEVLGDMLAELKDGHVNLLSTFNRSRNWSWYEGFPLFYDEQLIYDEYLKTDYRIIGPLLVQRVDRMLYVNYRSFERTISQQHMDEIVRLMHFHDGLIIDVRNNGGGNLQNALNIASRLVEKEVIYAKQRFKRGAGHTDFTPWTEMKIRPHDGNKYLGKVAILTNRRSYSSTSFFAQMIRTLPQSKLFGDQSGGGGGIPAFAELANGWTYRFSASQTIDLNDVQIEFGVPVDVVLTDPSLLMIGKDHFIEAAIQWLKE